MTAALLQKELRALVRDGRLLVLSLAVLVISLTVLALAEINREHRAAEKAAVEQETRAQWDQQGEKHPHRGAHFGLYVFAPESLLASFDPGVQQHFGQAIWLEPHRRNASRFAAASDDPMLGRFGEFTAAFVLSSILPLLIIAASYGSIAAERETGTLRMVRGLGASSDAFVWSKFSALVFTLAVLLLAIFAAVVVISGDVVRPLALGLAYFSYCMIYVAVGLAISALARTSRGAFVALLAVWLLFVWVVPRAASVIASTSVELPSAEQFWSDIRRDYQDGLPGDGNLATRSALFDEQLLREHGVSRLEDLSFGAYAVRRLHRDAYADRVHELHFNRLWQRLADQEQRLRELSLLSPTIAMQLLSMKLSGTDLSHRKLFEEAAERYRQYFNTHIDQWDATNSKGLRSFDERYGHEQLWRSVDRFTYQAPPAATVLRQTTKDFSILIAWALVSVAAFGLVARKVHA